MLLLTANPASKIIPHPLEKTILNELLKHFKNGALNYETTVIVSYSTIINRLQVSDVWKQNQKRIEENVNLNCETGRKHRSNWKNNQAKQRIQETYLCSPATIRTTASTINLSMPTLHKNNNPLGFGSSQKKLELVLSEQNKKFRLRRALEKLLWKAMDRFLIMTWK